MSVRRVNHTALVLSLIALAIVARPLLRPPRRERAAESNRQEQREQVLSYYERVLTNIRDLDEDRSTGKISDENYRMEREVWAQRGIRLLRALDQLEGAEDNADGVEQRDRRGGRSVSREPIKRANRGRRVSMKRLSWPALLWTAAVAGCLRRFGRGAGDRRHGGVMAPAARAIASTDDAWQPDIENGARIFAERCVDCHGSSTATAGASWCWPGASSGRSI